MYTLVGIVILETPASSEINAQTQHFAWCTTWTIRSKQSEGHATREEQYYLLLSVNRHLSLDRPWISPSNLQQWSATSHEKTLKVNNRLLVVRRCASSKKLQEIT